MNGPADNLHHDRAAHGSRVLTSGGDLGAAQRLRQLLLTLDRLRGRGVADSCDRRWDVAQAAGRLLHDARSTLSCHTLVARLIVTHEAPWGADLRSTSLHVAVWQGAACMSQLPAGHQPLNAGKLWMHPAT